MRYRDEKFYWTYHCCVGWPDDYIGPDSMTRWNIEKSVGFTDVGLYRISECQNIRIFDTKFPGLCEIFYSREYRECIDSTISFVE